MSLLIWTDGACEPNPGVGGWGWHSNDGKKQYGGELSTTNNRMEMMAILEALKQLPNGMEAVLYSDSQYCIKGLTIWRKAWSKRRWNRKSGEPMPNRDLWLELEDQVQRLSITFEWVKGHNGNTGNEEADRLASLGRLLVIGESSPYDQEDKTKAEPEDANNEFQELTERVKELEERLDTLDGQLINFVKSLLPKT